MLDTLYTVWVNSSDGYNTTKLWYTFHTALYYEPGLPENFTANAVNTNTIHLDWTIGINADKTYIEWNTTMSWQIGEGILLYNGTNNNTSHTGLIHNKTYYYQAWSWNETYSIFSSNYAMDNATTSINQPPIISNENPPNGSTNISVNISSISIYISDPEGDLFNWSIETNPNIGINIGNNENNGTKICYISNLNYNTTYIWYVNTSDQISGKWNNVTYIFITEESYNISIEKWVMPGGNESLIGKNITFNITHYSFVTYIFNINVTGNFSMIQINDTLPIGVDFWFYQFNISIDHDFEQQGRYLIWNISNISIISFSLKYHIINIIDCGNYYNHVDIYGDGVFYDNDSVCFIATGCSVNSPPNSPTYPNPEDGETGVSILKDLSWICLDPDNDPITYDVYFGKTLPPQKIVSNQSENTYEPGVMSYNTIYYWRIVAWDDNMQFNSSPIWSFTTQTVGNYPPVISDPDPYNNEINVSISIPSISVYIQDPEEDSIDWSIETSPNIGSSSGLNENSGRKICNVSNLAYSTVYTWYVNTTDSGSGVTSKSSFKFTTKLHINSPPYAPNNPHPEDGAINISKDTMLSVYVYDPNGDNLDVYFYNGLDNSMIAKDTGVSSGDRASVTWSNLEYNTTYEWYAIAVDSEFANTSEKWNFITKDDTDVDFEIDISGGIGINAYIKNIGTDDANNVKWIVNVKNKGLFLRFNESVEDTIDIIEPGSYVPVNFLLLRFGIIEINVYVECSCGKYNTENVDGFIIGFFVFITT
jgi:hypothetical protein